MRVAVSGRVYTVKPSASILLLRCASEVLLPPHGPPVITTWRYTAHKTELKDVRLLGSNSTCSNEATYPPHASSRAE
eukprot:12581595-Ditylum_brightwellii.AAC.1